MRFVPVEDKLLKNCRGACGAGLCTGYCGDHGYCCTGHPRVAAVSNGDCPADAIAALKNRAGGYPPFPGFMCVREKAPEKQAGSMTWTSAEKDPATYEIYGGNWGSNVETSSALDTVDDVWHSGTETGDRGVKVTFKMTVTITRFKGSYWNFNAPIKRVSESLIHPLPPDKGHLACDWLKVVSAAFFH